MNKFLFLSIITILIVISFNQIKESFIDLDYDDGAHFRESVVAIKNVNVEGTITANRLCPLNSNNCFDKDNMAFVKDDMPSLKDSEVCIGDECINLELLRNLKDLTIGKTQQIKIRAISSGTVVGRRGGETKFYINDNLVRNITPSRGFNVLVVTPIGNKHDFRVFDTHESYENTFQMINYLKNIPNEYYVAITVYDEAIHSAFPYINIYEHTYSGGWKKHYKMNANGSELRINSTWSGPSNNEPNNLFPNDNISSIDLTRGIKAHLYEHNFDEGRKLTINGPVSGRSVGSALNDEISTIKVEKINPNDYVTPFEAFRLFGGEPINVPNYRGSMIFIGKRGGTTNSAYQRKKDANANSSRDTRLDGTKAFLSNNLFYNITN
tara:strand:- start:4525 stop:5667 length:1143 start_codon:yes stop_codon:yes gene_type:complete